MDSCFPASDKNKLHFQAGERQICDVFHFTFECLCFATLTEIQKYRNTEIQKYRNCHSPSQATVPGLGLPLSCMGHGGFLSPEHPFGRAESFCILCAAGSAGETGDSGDSSCDLWLCPGLICVCALIAGHCSGPVEIISQGLHCCPCGLPSAWHIPDEQRSVFSPWDLWFMV